MSGGSSEVDALRARVSELEGRLAELESATGVLDAEFLSSLLNALPAFVVRVDADLRLRYINRLAEGYRMEDAIGRSMFEFIPAEFQEAARVSIGRALADGSVQHYQIRGQGGPNKLADYETIVAPVADAGGRSGVVLVAFDITEQAERQRALARSEERLRIAVEATGLGLWSWDLATNRTEWSERMCEIMGRNTPLGVADYKEAVHPEDREMIRAALRKIAGADENAWTAHRILRPDGETRWVIPCGRINTDDSGAVVHVVGGLLDVTPIRLLEQRLLQAERLESLGTLTAGVAHNFNNLLAVIRPTLDLLLDHVDRDGLPLLSEATVATDRATNVIRQLMVFAGTRRQLAGDSVDLGETVRSVVQLAQRLVAPEITLELDEVPEPLPVTTQVGEVEQVIINLITNARDALRSSRTRAPRIRVRVERTEHTPPTCAASVGGFARLVVEDNGPGVDPSIQPRIFDPFFTTKRPGEGTGLGLAISWSVARRLGGTLECVSNPHEGSSFVFYLPLDDRAEPRAATEPAPLPTARPLRLIVVDDDEAVVRAVTQALIHGGHEVLCASSVGACLALTETRPVSAILLDQSLPDGRGTNSVAALRERWAGAKIALFTGEDVNEHERKLVDVVLTKPLSMTQLLQALQTLAVSAR